MCIIIKSFVVVVKKSSYFQLDFNWVAISQISYETTFRDGTTDTYKANTYTEESLQPSEDNLRQIEDKLHKNGLFSLWQNSYSFF